MSEQDEEKSPDWELLIGKLSPFGGHCGPKINGLL